MVRRGEERVHRQHLPRCFIFITSFSPNIVKTLCTETDAGKLENQTAAQRDRFVDWITAAADARADATVGETKTKRLAAWRCWNDFLIAVGLEQTLFLDGYSPFHKNIVLSAFAQAVRQATFSRQSKNALVQSTVEATLS